MPSEIPTFADDIATIKAGVSGGIVDDIPAPSIEAPAPSEEAQEETSWEQPSFDNNTQEETDSKAPAGFGGNIQSSSQPAIDRDYIHELVESIIEEKWHEFVAKTGELTAWKERTTNDLIATKQEVLRLRESFEKLQFLMLGKTKEYSESMKDIHSEMKALEKVFERILEPLTSNIKELQRITDDLKKR